MSIYHGWTHAEKGDGGTDPVPLLRHAYLDDWDFEGNGALIPTDTWVSVTDTAAPPDIRYFTEFFRAGEFATDFDSGEISGSTAGAVYLASGSVTFGGDVDDDDTLMLGINFGAGIRHPFDHVARDNGFFRVTGTAMEALTLSTFPVHLSVWHDHGSDITLTAARLHVVRIGLLSSGAFEQRP